MAVDTGKCHCGQTEFEVTLGDRAHVLCHCGACQSLGGGPYSLNQVVGKDDLKITKGAPLGEYHYFGDSGNEVICYYCPNCTTHVYHHQKVMGDKLVVRTILLEGGNKFPPGAELYGKFRLPWIAEVATTFETTPPS